MNTLSPTDRSQQCWRNLDIIFEGARSRFKSLWSFSFRTGILWKDQNRMSLMQRSINANTRTFEVSGVPPKICSSFLKMKSHSSKALEFQILIPTWLVLCVRGCCQIWKATRFLFPNGRHDANKITQCPRCVLIFQNQWCWLKPPNSSGKAVKLDGTPNQYLLYANTLNSMESTGGQQQATVSPMSGRTNADGRDSEQILQKNWRPIVSNIQK